MQTKDSLKTYKIMEKGEAGACLDLAVDLVRENLKTFTHCFPDSNSRNNFYPQSDNREWTTGFWTGEIWLAYERTGEAVFREAGTVQAESFLKRIRERVDADNHDMGFLYTPSCVAAYRLTGNETAREAALLAADNLMGRFQEKGQFFQAWGQLGARDNYRLIIDCLLNMPLLFWASETTGDKRLPGKGRGPHPDGHELRDPAGSQHLPHVFLRPGDRGTREGRHPSGQPGRLRLEPRPGLGDLRKRIELPDREKCSVHGCVPEGDGLFPGASAVGSDSLLGFRF